jgi:hypothetical protein
VLSLGPSHARRRVGALATMPRVGSLWSESAETVNRIVRVNRSLSLSAVASCAMSLALSSILRSFAGFVHDHGPAVFFHLTRRIHFDQKRCEFSHTAQQRGSDRAARQQGGAHYAATRCKSSMNPERLDLHQSPSPKAACNTSNPSAH